VTFSSAVINILILQQIHEFCLQYWKSHHPNVARIICFWSCR